MQESAEEKGLKGSSGSLAERLQQLEKDKEILRRELWRLKRKPSATAAYTLVLSGAILLSASILFPSVIGAFVGLGLALWGSLLLYIKPSRFVRSSLLDSSAISSLTTINRMIVDLNYGGKGVYLPPKYLREVKGGTVFIPAKEVIIIPPVEEVAEGKLFLKNPDGICLTPPGLGLANLYEDELGVDFARVDLDYLQGNMPKLFIEGLEMAEDLEMNAKNNMVRAKIRGSIYQDLCREARRLSPGICSSIGCPLCSSIALAIARSAGEPVIIEGTRISAEGETIEADFRLLGKAEPEKGAGVAEVVEARPRRPS